MRSLRAPEMRPGGRTEAAGTIAGDTDGQGRERGDDDDEGDGSAEGAGVRLARPEIRVCLPTTGEGEAGDERLEAPPRRGATVLPIDGVIRHQFAVYEPGIYEAALIPAAVWDRMPERDRPCDAVRWVVDGETVGWHLLAAVGPLPADLRG